VTAAAGGLRVRGLSWSYGERKALDAVSFDVAPGRFCALLGPNGAGKSTLFSLLSYLFAPPKGAVEIDGIDLAARPTAALARMGVVFQQPTLDLDLSVLRNMRYFAALHGLAGPESEARIDAALARLGLSDRRRDRARALSGGQRRRMEIARALVHRPAVLLFDEPTAGLDAASRAAVVEHAHGLAAEGATVLWATHLVDEVHDGDDLVVLHRGRVVAAGRAAEVAGGLSLAQRFAALAP
jgi:ABC-2 type transport system ATP-binding protein